MKRLRCLLLISAFLFENAGPLFAQNTAPRLAVLHELIRDGKATNADRQEYAVLSSTGQIRHAVVARLVAEGKATEADKKEFEAWNVSGNPRHAVVARLVAEGKATQADQREYEAWNISSNPRHAVVARLVAEDKATEDEKREYIRFNTASRSERNWFRERRHLPRSGGILWQDFRKLKKPTRAAVSTNPGDCTLDDLKNFKQMISCQLSIGEQHSGTCINDRITEPHFIAFPANGKDGEAGFYFIQDEKIRLVKAEPEKRPYETKSKGYSETAEIPIEDVVSWGTYYHFKVVGKDNKPLIVDFSTFAPSKPEVSGCGWNGDEKLMKGSWKKIASVLGPNVWGPKACAAFKGQIISGIGSILRNLQQAQDGDHRASSLDIQYARELHLRRISNAYASLIRTNPYSVLKDQEIQKSISETVEDINKKYGKSLYGPAYLSKHETQDSDLGQKKVVGTEAVRGGNSQESSGASRSSVLTY